MFAHLIPKPEELDERRYSHRVRVDPAEQESWDARRRFTFYPDNKLRWYGNEPTRADDGRTEYRLPDEALARKFADFFCGEYMGPTPPHSDQRP